MLRVTTRITGGPGGTGWLQTHFGGSTEGEAVVAADAVESFWGGLINFFVNDLTYLVLNQVENIDIATGQITAVFPATTAAAVGGDSNEALPWATQLLAQLRTGDYVNGRELRGRMYIPGLPETASLNGMPNGAIITAVSNALDTLLVNSAAAGGLVVYSPTHRVASAVSSASVWANWATLRSRRD